MSEMAQGATMAEDLAQAFEGLRQVLAWLQAQGYAIAQSTIYKHRERGLIVPDSTGAFPRKAVEKYARDHLRKKGQAKDPVSDTTAQAKAAADQRASLARAELLELKSAQIKGELVPREWSVQELAKRALVLRHDLRNLAVSQSGAIVKACHGDPSRIPELIALLQEQFEALLDRYAQGVSLAPPAPLADPEEEPAS